VQYHKYYSAILPLNKILREKNHPLNKKRDNQKLLSNNENNNQLIHPLTNNRGERPPTKSN